jgi:molybdopterin/thiamine biosynthesis adenylyltransferase
MHLFQVGAGSGGMAVLDLVARDPRVTRVTLVEPDTYAPHNVYRHLFPPAAVGRLKADLAAEWVRAVRPDVSVEVLVADITDPDRQADFARRADSCDVGVCAADNEPAKFAFDALMRGAGKPWTLGEVLSGGIGGWVHRFAPGAACYGCVATHLKREVVEQPAGPPPDYADPRGARPETTIPANKASIAVIAGLHATVTLEMLGAGAAGGGREAPVQINGGAGREGESGENGALAPPARPDADFTSLLFSLRAVPGVFEVAYRAHRLRVPRSPTCLTCGAPAPPTGEPLDAAVDAALARLGAR